MTVEQLKDEFLKGFPIEVLRLIFRNTKNTTDWWCDISVNIIKQEGNTTTRETYSSNYRKEDMPILATIRKYLENKFYSRTEHTYKDKCYIKLEHSLKDDLIRMDFEEYAGDSQEYAYITYTIKPKDINDFFRICQELLSIEPQVRVKKFKDMYE
jgi:hypothetical protein